MEALVSTVSLKLTLVLPGEYSPLSAYNQTANGQKCLSSYFMTPGDLQG